MSWILYWRLKYLSFEHMIDSFDLFCINQMSRFSYLGFTNLDNNIDTFILNNIIVVYSISICFILCNTHIYSSCKFIYIYLYKNTILLYFHDTTVCLWYQWYTLSCYIFLIIIYMQNIVIYIIPPYMNDIRVY